MLVNEDGESAENEDTSDTGTPETEETEDEESGDSEQDSDQDSGDDNEDEGEEEGTLFFDPNKLPAELKPAFKKMQAAFTRSMQEASGVKKYASAYQALVADPGFRQWYEARVKGRPVNTESDDTEDGDPDIANPMAQRLERLELAELQNQATSEFRAFATKHPEWENFRPQMEAAIEKFPMLGYEEVFKLVTYDDARKLGNRDAIGNLSRKKRANINKPSPANAGSLPSKAPKTIQEAYLQAKKELAGRR